VSGETRRTSSKVRRLVPSEQREGKRVAVVKLEGGAGTASMVYARIQGAWRCLTYRQALVNEELVKTVVSKLFSGEGVVQSHDATKALTYGFDSPKMLRVSFHGAHALEQPHDDKLFSFDVGSTIATINGCYVRVTGTNEIWSIDVNLREELDPAERTPLPPLVDRMLIPSAWPGAKKGLKTIQIAPPGAPAYELELRGVEVTQEEQRTGKSPWQWFVKQAGAEQPANGRLSMSYAMFLRRALRLDVADRKLEPQAGFRTPRARVTLVPKEGEALVISIGSGQIGAGVPVVNSFGKTLDLADPLVARLLAPRAEQLVAADGPNPWEPFLER
jgi:hypothetical protein